MKSSAVALSCIAVVAGLTGCSAIGSSDPLPPAASSLATTPVAAGASVPRTLTAAELTRARSAIWARRALIAQNGLTIAALTDIEGRPDGQPGLVVYGKFTTVNARTNPSGVAAAVESLAGVPVLVDVVTPREQRRHVTVRWVTPAVKKAPAQP